MKLLLSFLVLIYPIDSVSQGKDKQESTYLRVKSGEDVTTYEFTSIQDFEENSEKILDEINLTNQPMKKGKIDNLTIEISITIVSEKESTTITGSVTASYLSIITEVKKLRTQLIAIATG
jgi:hypothetical protein